VLLHQLLKRNAAEAKTNWKGEKREMGLAKTNFFSLNKEQKSARAVASTIKYFDDRK
jgi:hypothetical protein